MFFRMHSLFNILFNAFLLFGTKRPNVAGSQPFDAGLQPLTVDMLNNASPSEFVPMERMSDQEIVSLTFAL